MLFHWKQVEALRNYASGNIIVEADSVEEAKKKAYAAAKKEIFDSRFGYYMTDSFDDLEEYQQEMFNDKMKELEEDLGNNPEIVETVCIWGSD